METYPRSKALDEARGGTLIFVMSCERARALVAAGKIKRDSGNLPEALKHYREAVALYRAEGNPDRLAHTIRHVADMDREAGNRSASEHAYRESLALYRDLRDVHGPDLANALNGFATLLAHKQDTTEAVLLTREARALYSQSNIEPGVEECGRRLASLTNKH